MTTKTRKYKIYCTWTCSKIVEVEAESFEDACDLAQDCDVSDGEYSDGSFDILREVSMDLSEMTDEEQMEMDIEL